MAMNNNIDQTLQTRGPGRGDSIFSAMYDSALTPLRAHEADEPNDTIAGEGTNVQEISVSIATTRCSSATAPSTSEDSTTAEDFTITAEYSINNPLDIISDLFKSFVDIGSEIAQLQSAMKERLRHEKKMISFLEKAPPARSNLDPFRISPLTVMFVGGSISSLQEKVLQLECIGEFFEASQKSFKQQHAKLTNLAKLLKKKQLNIDDTIRDLELRTARLTDGYDTIPQVERNKRRGKAIEMETEFVALNAMEEEAFQLKLKMGEMVPEVESLKSEVTQILQKFVGTLVDSHGDLVTEASRDEEVKHKKFLEIGLDAIQFEKTEYVHKFGSDGIPINTL